MAWFQNISTVLSLNDTHKETDVKVRIEQGITPVIILEQHRGDGEDDLIMIHTEQVEPLLEFLSYNWKLLKDQLPEKEEANAEEKETSSVQV